MRYGLQRFRVLPAVLGADTAERGADASIDNAMQPLAWSWRSPAGLADRLDLQRLNDA